MPFDPESQAQGRLNELLKMTDEEYEKEPRFVWQKRIDEIRHCEMQIKQAQRMKKSGVKF